MFIFSYDYNPLCIDGLKLSSTSVQMYKFKFVWLVNFILKSGTRLTTSNGQIGTKYTLKDQTSAGIVCYFHVYYD